MKKFIIAIMAVSMVFAACEKKVDAVDDYAVTVEFRNSNAKAITSDVTVNPKDSIYLDFTINSPEEDIAYVEIQKNGVRLDTFQLGGSANKRSFSKLKGYMADSIPGDYSYRVLARNDKTFFMGDGGKSIKVTVAADMIFYTLRVLKVPDTTDKANKAYFSLSEGKAYSYTEAAAASSKIDFGYFWDTTGRASSATTDDLAHTVYSLNAVPAQLNFYDVSSWTKNATVFKRFTFNFYTALTSGGAINTLVKSQMASGTSTKIDKLVTGNVVGFKTADGKYGAFYVRLVNGNSPAKTTSMEIDVKIQK